MQIKLPSFMTKIKLWSASSRRSKVSDADKSSFKVLKGVVSQRKIASCLIHTFFLLSGLVIKTFLFLLSDVFGGPHERRLLNDLMEHYNTLERPVYNESEPLTLLFGLTLQQIIDVVSIAGFGLDPNANIL